jgi:hypothetical protein
MSTILKANTFLKGVNLTTFQSFLIGVKPTKNIYKIFACGRVFDAQSCVRIPPLVHEGQSFKLIEGPSGGIFLHIGRSLRNDVSFRLFKLYFDELILFSGWRSDFVEERLSTNVPKLKVDSSAKEENLLAQKSNKHKIERREGSRVVHVKRNDLLRLFVHHLNGIKLDFRPWNVISFG